MSCYGTAGREFNDLGRFDEAIGHAETSVRTAETADNPFTLVPGGYYLTGN